MNRRVAAGPAALLAVVAEIGLAAPAYAHNQLTGSTPADGQVLDTAPASVTLDFLDSLEPANTTVTVSGPDGRAAASGSPVFDGSTVTVDLQVSSAGRYIVSYELISPDGHVGTGEIAFRLTDQAAPGPSPSPEAAPSPSGSPAADRQLRLGRAAWRPDCAGHWRGPVAAPRPRPAPRSPPAGHRPSPGPSQPAAPSARSVSRTP